MTQKNSDHALSHSQASFFLVLIVERVGEEVIKVARVLTDPLLFLLNIVRQAVKPPFRTRLIFQHLYFIGNQSINIIFLTSFFVGAVFGLELGGVFRIFGAEAMLGAATAKTLTRALSPLTTSFLLAGRGGAAIAAEIATMKVNEQVEAMEAMAVDPIHYLVVPRVIAAMIILPFLCGIFSFVGTIGAFVTGVLMFDVDQGLFFEKIAIIVFPKDIFDGLVKAFAFGGIMATIACYYGITATGGAEGVGRATTNSVVMTLLATLGCDLVLTFIQTVL